MSPDKAIQRIVELSAEAHVKRREAADDSPSFHSLTGAILAYGKALELLTKLKNDATPTNQRLLRTRKKTNPISHSKNRAAPPIKPCGIEDAITDAIEKASRILEKIDERWPSNSVPSKPCTYSRV